MVWRIIIFSRVAYKPPQQTLLYNTRRANAMTAIEKMLTGKMDMCAFMDLFKSDQNVQETIRNLVPQSAIANKEHPFWKNVSYDVLQKYDFDYLRFILTLCHLDGTLGESLNIFSMIKSAYCFYSPSLNCTTYYNDAYNTYLEAVGEYYEGPEVASLLEQIVREALLLSPKSKRIKEIRENLKKAFHIEHSKRPYWIQGGEWPMGKNSPMQYISRSKIPDGVKYIFQDVDTGEIREIEQFY